MADLDITGRVTMDASQAEGAFDRVGQRAGQMSDAVAGAATRAGDAVGRIGAGAEAGAETLTRSQSRMRDQIIRSTEAIENLGKTASQKLEIKIATQGLDPNIYAPYLARLREVEAAQAALRASGREAAAGAEEAGSAFDLLASKLAGFNVSAKDALVGLAAGFSAGAFVGWIKGAIDSADAASKLASSAGLAVEELAGLQLAFEGADAGNQLQATLSKLASEAQKGNAAFAAMGIAVTNSSGGLKSTRDLLAEVSDKFAGYRDGAEKTALAQQLLGESGAALIPLFNGGSAALDEFDESAKALGLTLSTEAAEAAGNFNDQIDLITQRSQGLARQLASELLPVLSTVSEQFGSAAKQGSSFSLIGTGLSVVLETITVVGSDVAFVLRTLARDALLVYNSAVKLATLDFSGIKSGFEAYKTETSDARKALEQFQAAVITARAVASAGDLDEPWVKRARMEAEQATEASKKLAPQIRDEAAARDANKKATEAETAAMKARLAAAASANTAFDEEFKAIESARAATEARIKTGRELLQSIERETAMLGMSSTARERAIAMFALERAGVVAGTEAYEAFAVSIRDAVNARGDKQALTDAVAATKAAEDQLAQFGLLKSEVQALTLARMEDARESAALAGEDVANIQKRIDAQKRLIAATAGLEVKEVNKKAADEAAKEWEKTADSINNSLTDALMRGFEDGKGFAKNLRDTLVNMFKTMVLRPIISAIVAPVGAAFSGAASAAGGGGMDSLGAIGQLSGLAGAFGTGMAASFSSVMAAGVGGWATAAGSLIGTGAMSGIAAGLGMIAAPVAALGLVISLLTKKTPGRQHEGGIYSSAGTDLRTVATNITGDSGYHDMLSRQSPALMGFVKTTVDAVMATATSKAKMLGLEIALGMDAGFTANLNGKGAQKNTFAQAQVFADGKLVNSYINNQLDGDPTKAAEQFTAQLNEMAAQAVLAGADLTRAGETSVQALDRLSSSMGMVNGVLDTLNVSLLETSLAGGDAASKLIDAFGGGDAFAAATSTYFQAFYSEAERTEIATRQLTTALAGMGLALPDSIAAYRALAESQDLTTDSGRNTYAALITLSGAFAEVTNASTATAEAVPAISQALAALLKDTDTLLADLAEAQGDLAGAAAMRYAIETKGMNDAERAAFDYNAALRDQIGVANALTQAIEASTSAQLSAIQKYAAPIDATSAAAALGPQVVASIMGKSADQIREMALVYVSSLDAQTEAGRAAIAAFEALTPSIDFFIGEAANAANALADPVVDLAPAADTAAASVQSLGDALSRFGDTLNLRADLLNNLSPQGPRPSLSVMAGGGAFSGLFNATENPAQVALSAWLDAEADAIEGYVADTERIIADARARLADPVYAIALEQYLQNFDADARGTATGLYARNFATGAAAFTQFFDDLGDFGETLAGQLATANDTAIGSALNLVAIGEYFAGLGTEIANIQAGLANAATMAGGGLSLDAATSGFATSIGGAATDIAAAINASIIAGIPEAIRNDPELAGLSTSLMAAVGSVGQGDVQGLNDSFLLLSGALTRGELTATQYAAAIDQVLASFAAGADGAAAVVDQLAIRQRLERQLLELQGDTAAIRLLEIAGMDAANIALYDRVQALTEEARVTQERNGLMTSLFQALGNTAALRAEQLAGLDPANRALQEQIFAIEDAKSALQKALEAERISAQAAVQAAQERVSAIKSIFDTLKSNVEGLRGSVESTKQQAADRANAFLENALSTARVTGYMPEADALTDAIAGARAGLDKQYATEFERQRDALVLAGKLSELQDISGDQLTIAERQLKAAESQVESLEGLRQQGQDLLDSLSGNTTATLSIVDAIAQLSAAVLGAGDAASVEAIAAASGVMSPSFEETSRIQNRASNFASNVVGDLDSVGAAAYRGALAAGQDPLAARESAMQSAATTMGLAANIMQQLSIAAFSSDGAAYGNLINGVVAQLPANSALLAELDLPSFAVGTNYVPRDMTARIHEGEAIVPRAYNPAANPGMSGNTERLESLIEGLTNRVQSLQTELVAIKTNTGQMAEQIDEVTEGGNAMRTRSRNVGVTA